MPSDETTRIISDIRAAVGMQLSGIYELDERIAFGGMGEVYRGHNIQTDDPVAIKIVLPEFARDETILSLFKKEASVLNHLSHDAIVRYHVFTVDPGMRRPYLAMEFVNGESLLDVMRRGPMPPEDIRKLCFRLASGLAAAHEAGIIHRDLSPDNVILPGGKVERAKIIDFGIARSAMVGGKTLLEGKFAGKYNYVSPEQLGLYGGEVSERSDIYSLGLVLAAAARGEPLDMSGTQVEVIEKRRAVPDVSGIDVSLRPLIEAMLQPDPNSRPATMAEIASWLSRTEATVPPQPGAAPVTVGPATVPPQPAAEPVWGNTSGSAKGVSTTDSETIAARMAEGGRGATPPASESPFGPYVPPPETPFTSKIMTVSKKGEGEAGGRRKPATARLTLLAGAAVVLVAGGVYYTDMFGRLFPPANEDMRPVTEEPLLKPEQPGQAKDTPRLPPQLARSEDTPPVTEEPLLKPEQPGQAKVTPRLPPQSERTEVSEEDPEQESRRELTEGGGDAAPGEQPAPQPDQTALGPDQADSPQDEPVQEQAARQPQQETSPETSPVPKSVAPQTKNPLRETNVAAAAINDVAGRLSWIKDYSGDGCFYATAISASDKAIDIEGFGRSVEPFTALLKDFQDTFHIEPNIGARLIEPEQCVVTEFLRGLRNSPGSAPALTLGQTIVPNGVELRGQLAKLNGRKTDLILIDHKGMAYSLNKHLAVSNGTTEFSINVGLAASDLAGRKTAPQVVVAIVSRNGIQAADFSRPVRASEVLPRVLAEIGSSDPESTAVAKYFRLGG